MTAMPAARLGDDIAHSQAMSGMLKGIAVGLAVGVLVGATIATGGVVLAVAAVGVGAGMVSLGGLAGAYIGEAAMGPATGKFVTGSPNVLINGRPATLTFVATAACSKEGGTPIPLATGSATVMINIGMAGRQGEKLGCSAVSIASTSPDVLIGGDSTKDPRVVITPEIPPGYIQALQMLGVAGAIMALPLAVATVGVGGTIGGAIAGFLGAAGGGMAGRALGEALGMSEAGIRTLETAGQMLGGFAGGFAGVKGGQRLQGRYNRLRAGGGGAARGTADDATPSPFMPKKPNDLEPGAVRSTPELEAARDAAKLRTGRTEPGYPNLPDKDARNFGDGVRPWNGDDHPGPIRRVIGADSNPNGEYWQAEIPATEAEWRAGSAVVNDWNGDGAFTESSARGLRGWIGPAAPQDATGAGLVLPGGGEQIWIPKGSATPSAPFRTPWNPGK